MTGSAPLPVGGAASLRLEGVTVRFNDFVALDDVSFEVPAGASLSVVGPNGAGKSTLVRVMLGLTVPLAGRVEVLGQRPGATPARIGYVPQLKTFDRTFPATALELVTTGLRRSWPGRIVPAERERALAALRRVGAAQLADRPLARLSGGELQRAYLARAFVREPALVVLDEPATGVDFLAERDINDLMEEYQAGSGATVVMITHDLAAARYHADHVLVLNRRVCGFGAPAAVMTDETLQAAFGHKRHRHAAAL